MTSIWQPKTMFPFILSLRRLVILTSTCLAIQAKLELQQVFSQLTDNHEKQSEEPR